MRTPRIISVLLLAFATSLVAQTTNPVVSYAYVGTTAKHIYAYAVRANGATTALAGSPFAGASAEIANTTNYLFATDGTNIVSYLRSSSGAVHPEATVNGVAHNDTPQGSGVGALTLDRTGASLYAGEFNFQGADNNAFAEFAKLGSGALSFQRNSIINVNYGGWLQFSHSNQFAYGTGCYFLGWQVFGFYRGSNGALTSFDTGNTRPPVMNADICPGAAASSARNYLAVAYSTVGTVSNARIAIYQITSSGALNLVSTITTSFATIGDMHFDPSGNYLAVGGNGVAVYRLNSNATLTKVSGRLDTTVKFNSVQWDHTWHVLATSQAAFYSFNARYGVLAQVGSPHPVAFSSTNVAVVPLQ